jgi:hypothetical protein
MRRLFRSLLVSMSVSLLVANLALFVAAQSKPNVQQTTLEEPNQTTPEISTDELKRVLARERTRA